MSKTTALLAALTLATTAACAAGEVEDDCALGTRDSDGDGLTDCEERDLGTAPQLADTDGDGLSDFDEVVELGFSADNNNFKFNPRIADTPHIRVDITSAPDIALLYESSTGTEKSHSVERSTSSSQTVTTSESSTNSQAIETTETVGGSVTVGAEAGFPGGSASVEATVSYESSETTTSETSVTWTEEQSSENSQGFAEAEAVAHSEGTAVHGGSIAVTVDIVNDGNVAFTLDNLAISAYMTTPGLDQIISPVGGLSFDTTQSSFPAFTYAPGQGNGPFVFSNDGLDTGTAQALLENSSNLNVGVVAFELTDENGRSFTHNMTDISAKTATVIIDYGDPALGHTERYLVATNTDASRLRITARSALEDVLRVPYTVTPDGNLDGVRSVRADLARDGYWLVVHKTSNGLANQIAMHSDLTAAYDFDAIELQSGDVLHLVYREDIDGDGLGYRQEVAYGTAVDRADTDGDGISDFDEVTVTKTNPTRADTNGDGISDGVEVSRVDASAHTRAR